MNDHPTDTVTPDTRTRPTRVQFFVTCLVDRFFPDTGMSAVAVLERLGLDVRVPDGQTCCGQPAFNAGYTKDARALARHTLDVLSRTTDPIVIPSGSCGDMVIHQYETLFHDDEAYLRKAREVAGRTHEFTQFLVNVMGVTDVGAEWSGKLTYHACCHGLRGLGAKDEPEHLLAGVRRVERCPLAEADVCCGFGGLFSVKLPEISSAMLARKLDSVEATGADAVVVTDVSCGMHMEGGLRRRGSRMRVHHIADVLAARGTTP